MSNSNLHMVQHTSIRAIEELIEEFPFSIVIYQKDLQIRIANKSAESLPNVFYQSEEIKQQVRRCFNQENNAEEHIQVIEGHKYIQFFYMSELELVSVLIMDDYITEYEKYKSESMDLKAIFETSYDVMYVSDGEGNTIRASSACLELWGKKENELIGRNVIDLEKEGIYTPSITRLVLEQKKKVSAIQTTKEGRRLMVVGTPIKNEQGEVIRVINASRDITEVSQMQSEISEMKRLIAGYKQELMELKKDKTEKVKLISYSKKMEKTLELARRVANVDSTVLILGESGVGKEMVANLIHETSDRKNSPFIKVNCGAIPENLLESELFGYEGGAFTGAKKEGKMGLFELANKGTLFLDEIAEMPLALQVKLLRVLQEREVMRVGGVKPVAVNVRIIAATNRNLHEDVQKGNFREDLYYRLNVIPLSILPLRERREDILPLASYFIEQFNQKYLTKKTLSAETAEAFELYNWPGNVRELQNIVERLIVMSDGDEIQHLHLPEEITNLSSNRDKVQVLDILPLKECMEMAEKQLLRLAKQKYSSTVKIADALQVNQSTISRKLQKLNE
ncbi:sigma 54-interacting transcriptional regulator [Priestia aryabhattai]|uniref:sigma-54 interaction domain-containing protein n=1 Tax=Priestia TaxID=2800373 RepID=UPI001CD393A7|nr:MULTISPECIES: sigma 54-interacting transcriptional regulator [Priestia]MCA1048369.1 sigma 54-interacting transcriptional regulator [Priestia aryabhattai]MDT0148660.1 sigma 54-interacting transcriptional regulator [Priestia aryabhattai]MDT0153474.1 sigma 54-interacting transcriptional regulator [Priestia aryabhattai]MEB4857457.1 sigma 54-interacting transcriptional regulator [Priestia megaterium]MEB4871129.1 sigma 54-interacting transcriptional regulator [Priestia megaterium]